MIARCETLWLANVKANHTHVCWTHSQPASYDDSGFAQPGPQSLLTALMLAIEVCSTGVV